MEYFEFYKRSSPKKKSSPKKSSSPKRKSSPKKSFSRSASPTRKGSPYKSHSRRSPRKSSGVSKELSKFIINNFVSQNFELCGIFDDNFNIVTNSITKGIEDLNKNGNALNCQHKEYSRYIWHTHSHVSKYYPSVQDITKILKRQQIEISFIFHKYGYWKLSALRKGNSFNEKEINKVLDKFYHISSRGREYNKESIKWLKEHLEELLEDYGFNIDFIKISI